MNTDTPETDAVVFSPHVYWPDFARRLELERNEARQSIAALNQRLTERQESFQAQLIRIEDVWREKLREKDTQIVAFQNAVQPFLDVVFVDPSDRKLANAAKAVEAALSAPAPAVVPLEDVRPLIEAVKNTRHLRNTSFNRSTGKMDGIIVNSDLFWKLKDALAAITEKYQL